ncbi:MAG: hypothetical protein Q7T77_04665 [Sulfuricurvum sp.]|nr:hypothetical protein [Sulfuricurvum sp.]
MNQNDIIQLHDPEPSQYGGMKRCFTFLGGKECYESYNGNNNSINDSINDSINKYIQKRIKAYNLIPDGAIVIPRSLVPLFQGWFIGGVLEDSLSRVYGICHDRGGITGYSCSVYWVPTKDEMDNITVDMRKVHGDFDIKTKSYCEEEIKNGPR